MLVHVGTCIGNVSVDTVYVVVPLYHDLVVPKVRGYLDTMFCGLLSLLCWEEDRWGGDTGVVAMLLTGDPI